MTENPFKVGDYVRMVDPGPYEPGAPVGTILRVTAVRDNGCLCLFPGSHFIASGVAPTRVELVTVEPVKAPQVWIVAWKFRSYGTREEAAAFARSASKLNPDADHAIARASTIVRGTVLIDGREPVVGDGIEREFNEKLKEWRDAEQGSAS